MTLKIIDMTEACSADEYTFAVWDTYANSWHRSWDDHNARFVWTVETWDETEFGADLKQRVRNLLPKRVRSAHLSRKQFQMATIHENVTGDWVDDPEELDQILKDWNPSKQKVIP